ncbi:MAG TPA: succinylglutamate desuccinylase/aspartoacylase family protein [Phycisphaerae bacterium]|nr:succinylglutamate desuccinylase/aspartoacylase family protein [Phycisphaerales bacterium]HRX83511.1 succinylglutamate desuccinylase/aspartoacylase family protein [Phycisphaerae bacterium]
MAGRNQLEFGGRRVRLGERRDIDLIVSQSYAGQPVVMPITVWRAEQPGPTVFVTAAVHGDELNGTGVVRALILDSPFELSAGTLVLVPVVNILGFERHIRYLPDRRDLNRAFPGSAEGSLARRIAHAVFSEVVQRCDFGIDLHTAAVRRTNFPNIRADLSNAAVARLANAFGCELIVNGRGPRGSLRRAACRAGRPTIMLEAGEVWKIEPAVGEYGVRGVRNVLVELGMVEGERRAPAYQVHIDDTTWIRAEEGGILQFHIAPGDVVEADQPIATNSNLHGKHQTVLRSPADGIVLGMTTLPAVTPGEPVCHLAIPRNGVAGVRSAQAQAKSGSLHRRLKRDLSTNVSVSDFADEPASDAP